MYPEPGADDPNEPREMLRHRLSIWRDDAQKRKEHNEELFNWIMQHLAPDSYTLITVPGDRYQQMQRDSNVFVLWLLLEEYHTGMDSFTQSKRALMQTKATRKLFPEFTNYSDFVYTNVAQLETGRIPVDPQDISTWVLDATAVRFTVDAGIINL
jgi:hypothetical protein